MQPTAVNRQATAQVPKLTSPGVLLPSREFVAEDFRHELNSRKAGVLRGLPPQPTWLRQQLLPRLPVAVDLVCEEYRDAEVMTAVDRAPPPQPRWLRQRCAR